MNLQLYDHIIGSHGARLATPRGRLEEWKFETSKELQTYQRAYSEGKLGKGIYKHMWLFKGEGTEEDIEVRIIFWELWAIFSSSQTRVTLEEALLFTSASLFYTATSCRLHCFMLPRHCGLLSLKVTFLQKHFSRNEVEGTMLEERFGLGEWEEGGVGGADAENCTFW